MFTGIIEQQGTVQNKTKGRLLIESASKFVKELHLGASVAVNGACLTVSGFPTKTAFAADVMPETLKRTMLGTLETGDAVNLELPLRVGEQLGGHMVQGHVDSTAKLVRVTEKGNSVKLTFSAPKRIIGHLVEKGSVAIQGISLTVIDIGATTFSVGIIPYTKDRTTLSHISLGDEVNVEVDMVAKYVRSCISSSLSKRHEK